MGALLVLWMTVKNGSGFTASKKDKEDTIAALIAVLLVVAIGVFAWIVPFPGTSA